MASLFPREEHAEALFHRILSNPGAEQQLYETFLHGAGECIV